jgi:TnsA endonuclease N terminal
MLILMDLDFRAKVFNVISQPFLMSFQSPDISLKHVPDFLVVHTNGDQELIDVKPAKYVNREKTKQSFDTTEKFCSYLGWRYNVRSEPDATYVTNLMWLAGFRKKPSNAAQYTNAITDALLEESKNIKTLLEKFDNPTLVQPTLFHLLWLRQFSIANRPEAPYRKFEPTRPGEVVLLDSTPLDAFAIDPITFRWVQVQLTVAHDLYTRSILSWIFTPISTKSVDATLLLYGILHPKRMRPGWPDSARWNYVGVPSISLLN